MGLKSFPMPSPVPGSSVFVFMLVVVRRRRVSGLWRARGLRHHRIRWFDDGF
jgi:hypothetical protein